MYTDFTLVVTWQYWRASGSSKVCQEMNDLNGGNEKCLLV